MKNPTARLERCTIVRRLGDFCDLPSIEDGPFPVCAKHALKLYRHLADLSDAELSDLAPAPANQAPNTRTLRGHQNKALAAIQAGQSLVYAVKFPDGIIKIGCSSNLAKRMDAYRCDGGELVGFMPGDYALEQEIHKTLREHLTRGREWYLGVPAVIAIVNEMRDGFNMPHIAA